MKKKVAHLSNAEQGISLFLLPQLEALQQAGYEVHAICPIRTEREFLTEKGIIVHHLEVTRDITFIVDVFMFFKLLAIMFKERFYIVHAHSAKMEFFGQLAARLAFVPHVMYTNHGMIFRSKVSNVKKTILVTMARFSGWLSDHIFSQSREDMDYSKEHRIYKPNKISYLGNGIDVHHFDLMNFSNDAIARIKLELGIPSGVPVIGIVARFVREKGYMEFIKAAKLLLNDQRDCYFVCVGNEMPNERDPVDFDILDELAIKDRFVILKSQKDMPRLYAVMDIVVLPSYREGFPRTLMEAAAMSKPTIASNISGCREAVNDGANGILVPVKEIEPLAKAIQMILENKQLAKDMGSKGRELACSNFDQDKVVSRLLNQYNKIQND